MEKSPKIIYAKKKGLANKTNDQIFEMLMSGQNIPALAQEIWRRQHSGMMYMLARSKEALQNKDIFRIIAKFIETNRSESDRVDIFLALLSHHPSEYPHDNQTISHLRSIASSSPIMAAVALISKSTPVEVVAQIIQNNKLNQTKEALYLGESMNQSVVNQNKILEAITTLLSNGYTWENVYSAGILMKRIESNGADKFVAEMAKYDMHPEIAAEMDKVVNQWGKFNPRLKQNFTTNKSNGIHMFKLSQDLLTIEQHPEESIHSIVDWLAEESNLQNIQYSYSKLKYKCKQYPEVFRACIIESHRGKNILMEFANQNTQIMKDCFKFCLQTGIANGMTQDIDLKDFFIDFSKKVVNDHGMDDLLQFIPSDIRQYLPLTSEQRSSLQEKEEEHVPFDHRSLIRRINASNIDWYEMHKESGAKSFLSAALLSAITAVLYHNVSVEQASEQFNVGPQEIVENISEESPRHSEEDIRRFFDPTYQDNQHEPKQEPKTTNTSAEIDITKIAQIESSGNPNAVGKAGERGLTQILNEKTWNWIVKDMGKSYKWDEAFKGSINLAVGNHYINVMIPKMLRQYEIPDSIEARISAYNWGIGNLKKSYERDPRGWTDNLPPTTRNYIQKYKN